MLNPFPSYNTYIVNKSIPSPPNLQQQQRQKTQNKVLNVLLKNNPLEYKVLVFLFTYKRPGCSHFDVYLLDTGILHNQLDLS